MVALAAALACLGGSPAWAQECPDCDAALEVSAAEATCLEPRLGSALQRKGELVVVSIAECQGAADRSRLDVLPIFRPASREGASHGRLAFIFRRLDAECLHRRLLARPPRQKFKFDAGQCG
jgi:hypothetical protein